LKSFRTKEIIDLYTGVIGLNDDQAAPRLERLKETKKGEYEILAHVQFKAGEVIGLNVTSLPKVVLSKLEPIVTNKGGKKVS